MNFFESQEKARSKTSTLLVLLFLAVVLTILAGAFAAKLCLILVENSQALSRSPTTPQIFNMIWNGFSGWYRDPVVHYVAGGTAALILLGSFFQSLRLMGGGATVAKLMGARAIEPSTKDPSERRLLNLVEEMSIASGTPVPRTYLMDTELGINAFAAGFSPSDATITVSRGSLDQLTRDEMQGVIAHEFSHIFNGDMTLNMRLMGVLAGILLIGKVGMTILRNLPQRRYRSSSSKDKGGGGLIFVLFVFGLLIMLIGYIGFFFGRLIKAAISRQREFLADASSVQFTRNPLGIGGALQKIRASTQGATLLNGRTEDVSHMLFCDGLKASFFGMLATHPSIDERLNAINPMLVKEEVKLKQIAPAAPPTPTAASRLADPDLEGLSAATMAGFAAQAPIIHQTASQAAASVGQLSEAHLVFAQGLLASLPPSLRQATQTPNGARGVVYALFMEPLASAAGSILKKQTDYLRQQKEDSALPHAEATQKLLPELGDRVRLPLLDLCLPMLARMLPEMQTAFLKHVGFLVQADGRVDLFEFALQAVLAHRLAQPRVAKPKVKFKSIEDLVPEVRLLVSVLAFAGHSSPTEAEPAFKKAIATLSNSRFPVQVVVQASPKDCSPQNLNAALVRLRQAGPLVKEQVVRAFTECSLADGKVTIREAELLRALTEAIDCPMPPLLTG